MLKKMLKKDLKRKKAMNIILFIFLLTASALIAGSTNLLYSTVSAVDYFIGKSDVADLIAITNSDQKIADAIQKWVKSSDIAKDAQAEDAIILDMKSLTASTGKNLENTSPFMLMQMPREYNMIFDRDGKDFEVGPSEAAVPVIIQKKLGLSIGDHLTINLNGYVKELTVTTIFKDVVMGSEFMGMKRIILNETDFKEYFENAKVEEKLRLWGFSREENYQNRELEKEYADLILPTFGMISKDLIKTAYIFDMVLAAVMIIVSIFLILISFLILRFTIVFTVMEDYKEIGVMKAIGLKSSKIRKMYSLKYLMLSAVAGVIGFVLSIPISNVMKQSISDYILLKQSPMKWLISFVSVLAVVGITILFCNYSTRKIKKISAIEAIRQGNTGERFKNTKKLKLNRHKRMMVPLFLACSDIVSDFKKFIILIITFVLGTAIIIIPSNVISTLSSEDTISLFGYVIAVTEKVATFLKVDIGDKILCDIQNDTREYIITALFQTMNSLGNGVRLSEGFHADNGSNTATQISGTLTGSKAEKEVQLEKLKKSFPKLEFKTGKEVSLTESFSAWSWHGCFLPGFLPSGFITAQVKNRIMNIW